MSQFFEEEAVVVDDHGDGSERGESEDDESGDDGSLNGFIVDDDGDDDDGSDCSDGRSLYRRVDGGAGFYDSDDSSQGSDDDLDSYCSSEEGRSLSGEDSESEDGAGGEEMEEEDGGHAGVEDAETLHEHVREFFRKARDDVAFDDGLLAEVLCAISGKRILVGLVPSVESALSEMVDDECVRLEAERVRLKSVGEDVNKRDNRSLYFRRDRYLKKVARSVFQLLWCRQRVERGLRARAPPRDHATLTLGSTIVVERLRSGVDDDGAEPLRLLWVAFERRLAEQNQVQSQHPARDAIASLCRTLLANLGSVRSDETLDNEFRKMLESSCFRRRDGHPWIFSDPSLLRAMNEFGASLDDDLPENDVLPPWGEYRENWAEAFRELRRRTLVLRGLSRDRHRHGSRRAARDVRVGILSKLPPMFLRQPMDAAKRKRIQRLKHGPQRNNCVSKFEACLDAMSGNDLVEVEARTISMIQDAERCIDLSNPIFAFRRVAMVRNLVVEQQRLVLDTPSPVRLQFVARNSARVVVLCSWWTGKPSYSAECDARRDLAFVLGYAEILIRLSISDPFPSESRRESFVVDALVLLRAAMRLEPYAEERVYQLFEVATGIAWTLGLRLPFDVAVDSLEPAAVPASTMDDVALAASRRTVLRIPELASSTNMAAMVLCRTLGDVVDELELKEKGVLRAALSAARSVDAYLDLHGDVSPRKCVFLAESSYTVPDVGASVHTTGDRFLTERHLWTRYHPDMAVLHADVENNIREISRDTGEEMLLQSKIDDLVQARGRVQQDTAPMDIEALETALFEARMELDAHHQGIADHVDYLEAQAAELTNGRCCCCPSFFPALAARDELQARAEAEYERVLSEKSHEFERIDREIRSVRRELARLGVYADWNEDYEDDLQMVASEAVDRRAYLRELVLVKSSQVQEELMVAQEELEALLLEHDYRQASFGPGSEPLGANTAIPVLEARIASLREQLDGTETETGDATATQLQVDDLCAVLRRLHRVRDSLMEPQHAASAAMAMFHAREAELLQVNCGYTFEPVRRFSLELCEAKESACAVTSRESFCAPSINPLFIMVAAHLNLEDVRSRRIPEHIRVDSPSPPRTIDTAIPSTTGIERRPLTTVEANAAMRSYMSAIDPTNFERSGSCASCGMLIGEEEETWITLDREVADLFNHQRCCERGVHEDNIRSQDQGAPTDSFADVKASWDERLAVGEMKVAHYKDAVATLEEELDLMLGVITEGVDAAFIAEFEEVREMLGQASDSLGCAQQELETIRDDCDDALMDAHARDELSIDECFHIGDRVYVRGPPPLLSVSATIATERQRDGRYLLDYDKPAERKSCEDLYHCCPMDRHCPFRAMLHGLHQTVPPGGHEQCVLLLLRDAEYNWRDGRRHVVKAWRTFIDAGGDEREEFRLCPSCAVGLRKRDRYGKLQLPRQAFARTQMPVVPAAEVYPHPEREGHVLTKYEDNGEPVLLPKPGIMEREMISAFRFNLFICSLYSQSEKNRRASGATAFDRAAQCAKRNKPFRPRNYGRPDLNTASVGHLSIMRNNVLDMRAKLSEFGPTSRNGAKALIKACIASPKHNRAQLLASIAKAPAFEVRVEVVNSWMTYLELMHLPEFYDEGSAERHRAELQREIAEDNTLPVDDDRRICFFADRVLTLSANEKEHANKLAKALRDTRRGKRSDTNAGTSFSVTGFQDTDVGGLTEDQLMQSAAARHRIAKIRAERANGNPTYGAAELVQIHALCRENEFNQRYLVVGGHPDVFHNGRGIYGDPQVRRRNHLSPQRWKKVASGLANRGFAQHQTLWHNLGNMDVRHEILRRASFFFDKEEYNGCTAPKDVDQEVLTEIVRRLSNGDRAPDLMAAYPQLAHIVQAIKVVYSGVEGSPLQRATFRDPIFAVTTCDGTANVWLTINIDTSNYVSVTLLTGATDRQAIHVGPIPRLREINAMEPLAAGKFFNHLCDAILHCLLGGVRTGRRGALGTLRNAVRVYECYDRGDLHSHWLLWVREMMNAHAHFLTSMGRAQLGQVVVDFIDSVSTACVRPCVLHPVEPEPTERKRRRMEVERERFAFASAYYFERNKLPPGWFTENAHLPGGAVLDLVRARADEAMADADDEEAARAIHEASIAEGQYMLELFFEQQELLQLQPKERRPGVDCDVDPRCIDDTKFDFNDLAGESQLRGVVRLPPAVDAVTARLMGLDSEPAFGEAFRARAQRGLERLVPDRSPETHWEMREWADESATFIKMRGEAPTVAPERAMAMREIIEGISMLRHSALAVQKNLHGDFNRKSGRRECHAGCFKTNAARKRKLCRLGYGEDGRVLVEYSYVDSDGNVVVERDFAHVVPHSHAMTIVLRCNNCVEFSFSGIEAFAVMLYLTSYVVKGELSLLNLSSLMLTVLRKENLEGTIAHADDDKEKFYQRVGKYLMGVAGSISVPAQWNGLVQQGIKRELVTMRTININTSAMLRIADAIGELVGVPAVRTKKRGELDAGISSNGVLMLTDSHGHVRFNDLHRDYMLRGEIDEYGELTSEYLRELSFVRFVREVKYDTRQQCSGRAQKGHERYELHHDHPDREVGLHRRAGSRAAVNLKGPTPTPKWSHEAFAQFVLFFFKPVSGDARDLLRKTDGVGFYRSWAEALDNWSWGERLRSDSEWTMDPNGALQHAMMRNLELMFEGQTRAERMSKSMAKQTVDERLGLRASDGSSHRVVSEGASCNDQSREWREAPPPSLHVALRYTRQKAVNSNACRLRNFANTSLRHMQELLRTSSTLCSNQSRPRSVHDNRTTAYRVGDTDGLVEADADTINDWITKRDALSERIAGISRPQSNGSNAQSSSARGDEALGHGYEYCVRAVDADAEPEARRDAKFEADRVGASFRRLLPVQSQALTRPGEIFALYGAETKQALATYVQYVSQMRIHQSEEGEQSTEATTTTRKALRLLVHGGPGTGKSRVLRMTDELLQTRGLEKTMGGGAFTGRASVAVGLSTLHSDLNLRVRSRNRDGGGPSHVALGGGGSAAKKADVGGQHSKRDYELQDLYQRQRRSLYRIDEISLVWAGLLWRLHCKLCWLAQKLRKYYGIPFGLFGGLDFVSYGDFMQQPPIGATLYGPLNHADGHAEDVERRLEAAYRRVFPEESQGKEPLFADADAESVDCDNEQVSDDTDVSLGRALWRLATTDVIILDVQRRTADRFLQHVCQRLRWGSGDEALAEEMRKSILNRLPPAKRRNFVMQKFYTQRHAVIDRYNSHTLELFCVRTNTMLVEWEAEDRVSDGSKDGTEPQEWVTQMLREESSVFTQSRTQHVATLARVANGVPLVLKNGKRTRARLGGVNGAECTLVGIAKSPLEPATRDVRSGPFGLRILRLRKVPKLLLVKLRDATLMRGERIGTLPLGVIPIEPDRVFFSFEPAKINNKWHNVATTISRASNVDPPPQTVRIRRDGFTARLAFASTGFEEQGAEIGRSDNDPGGRHRMYCTIDASAPPRRRDDDRSIYVFTSRASSWDRVSYANDFDTKYVLQSRPNEKLYKEMWRLTERHRDTMARWNEDGTVGGFIEELVATRDAMRQYADAWNTANASLGKRLLRDKNGRTRSPDTSLTSDCVKWRRAYDHLERMISDAESLKIPIRKTIECSQCRAISANAASRQEDPPLCGFCVDEAENGGRPY